MSKESSPAFQVYPAEYLADINTQVMTPEEEGCYWRLMLYCWREQFIPNDIEALTVLCKGVKPTLRVVKCFTQDGDKLRHKRLDLERQKQREWVTKSREAGYKSAEKRWGYKRKHQVTNLTPMVTENRNQGGNQTVTLQSSISSSIASSKITPKSPKGDLCEIGKTCNGKFEECGKAFERFWVAYPRHDPPRKEARKSWCRKYCEGIDIEKILIWITEARNRWMDKKYIPQPTTWLNQRRWEGDLPPIPDEIRPKQRDILDDLLAQAEKEEHG